MIIGVPQVSDTLSEGIALLKNLAEKGEINPWDVQVIEVIDRYLSKLTPESNISASDESQLPTSIELLTNISEGWRQYELNEGEFSFTVSQGSGINGLHLSIIERHLEKEPTEIGMWLAVTDDAGNTVTKEWKIEITLIANNSKE